MPRMAPGDVRGPKAFASLRGGPGGAQPGGRSSGPGAQPARPLRARFQIRGEWVFHWFLYHWPAAAICLRPRLRTETAICLRCRDDLNTLWNSRETSGSASESRGQDISRRRKRFAHRDHRDVTGISRAAEWPPGSPADRPLGSPADGPPWAPARPRPGPGPRPRRPAPARPWTGPGPAPARPRLLGALTLLECNSLTVLECYSLPL